MKYMGSKARYAKEILPIILKDRKPEQWYIEPFAGGMNMIDKVEGNRIANDINEPLVAMWDALVYSNWKPPHRITKEDYNEIRKQKTNYKPELIGWVGFCCSYSGKYFGGYAGDYPESRRLKNGTLPNYQQEAINSTAKQIPKLKGVKFTNKNYWEIEIPKDSVIYCDPPYQNTTKYATDFDHNLFWEWCRELSKQGHSVWVSEYNAPSDFKCVWEKKATSQLSANGKIGGSKISTEKLFLYCG
jgi:DNA adenine methylase